MDPDFVFDSLRDLEQINRVVHDIGQPTLDNTLRARAFAYFFAPSPEQARQRLVKFHDLLRAEANKAAGEHDSFRSQRLLQGSRLAVNLAMRMKLADAQKSLGKSTNKTITELVPELMELSEVIEDYAQITGR